MSEQSDPREQAAASTEQDLKPKDLKPKDLEPKSEEADQVRGGGQTTTSTSKSKGAFEIKDFSFGVENPTTIGS